LEATDMKTTPIVTIDDAIRRLYLRAEIAADASLRVDRPDFADQAKDFRTIAEFLERVRN
jgi:hypothetical protein